MEYKPRPEMHTKCTPGRVDRICELVRNHHTHAQAARAVGISPSTLLTWLSKGEQGVEPYSDLFERLNLAEAEARDESLQRVVTAAKDGKAENDRWLLERRHGFHAKQDIDLSGSVGLQATGPQADMSRLTDDELALYEWLVQKMTVEQDQLAELPPCPALSGYIDVDYSEIEE